MIEAFDLREKYQHAQSDLLDVVFGHRGLESKFRASQLVIADEEGKAVSPHMAVTFAYPLSKRQQKAFDGFQSEIPVTVNFQNDGKRKASPAQRTREFFGKLFSLDI